MSRSKKKVNITKDSGIKDYNSRYRTVVNQKLKEQLKTLELDEIGTLPLSSEITNQYDICDYKFFNDDIKYLRK